MIKEETVNENLCFGKKKREKGLLGFREGGEKEEREEKEGRGRKGRAQGTLSGTILQTGYLSGSPTGSKARV